MTDSINAIHYPRLAQAFYFEPLALEMGMALAVHSVLWPRITGAIPQESIVTTAAANPNSINYGGSAAHMRKTIAAPAMQSNGPYAPSTVIDPNYYWTLDEKPNVAVIPVNGMMFKGAGMFQEMCGNMVNTDRVTLALNQAMAAKSIDTIVLDVNSPGGRTVGMQELASVVKQATATRGKTVYTFTEQQAASAGLCMICQCDEIILTPSASLGSIGVYCAFLNSEIAMKMQGFSLEFFGAGKHKGMGLPGKPLSQDDRALLQAGVDKEAAQFIATVKAGPRKASEDALTSAKMYQGQEAVTNGLADAVVSSWDEFCSLL